MCEFSRYDFSEMPKPDHVERVAEAKKIGATMPWVDGWIDEAIEPNWIDQRKRGVQADA